MNQVTYFEIGGTDTAKAAGFYGELFGWTFADGPVKSIEGAGLPGHLNRLGHEPHNYILVYVAVDDLATSLERTVELGGKVVVGPIQIPTGRFAWITDPTGTTIGLWQHAG